MKPKNPKPLNITVELVQDEAARVAAVPAMAAVIRHEVFDAVRDSEIVLAKAWNLLHKPLPGIDQDEQKRRERIAELEAELKRLRGQ